MAAMRSSEIAALLPLSLLLLLASTVDGFSTRSVEGSSISTEQHPATANFTAFMQKHGRTYSVGSKEYQMRFALFQERLAAIEAHNGQPDRSWRAVVNALADRTPAELSRLRGYRHSPREGGGDQAAGAGPVGLMGTSAAVHSRDLEAMPKDFTWQSHLNSMKDVRDQGACGSCWAVSSATVLRAHAELYQNDRTFSVQQIISCTPNPRSCGGSGGCQGATAELAMDYVAKVGLVTEDAMEYAASDSSCPTAMQPPKKSLRSALKETVSLPDVSIQGGGGASFGMLGWRKLPENKVEPLLLALYYQGPVVVSVAASDVWNSYGSGVMQACNKDAVINHAVALTGYGEERGTKYWQIQNSWGPDWGEAGFGRLVRLDRHEEGAYCGWDRSPQVGTGCAGGPPKVYVCGSCGILYDSVVPKFQLSDSGWWARVGGRRLNSTEI